MSRFTSRVAAAGAAAAMLAGGPACRAAAEFGGLVQMDAVHAQAATLGPLALANARVAGVAPQPGLTLAPQLQLRASAAGLFAVATLQHRAVRGQADDSSATFNELYGSTTAGDWLLTGGRRIVSWDVGEGFRPNDVVQQEPRRPLVPVLPVGRTVLMADHFGSQAAGSVLLVNPQNAARERGAAEPALAARLYLRDGAVDWHAIARWGRRTRGSLGGAFAWVASDTLELHGSARWLSAADTLADATADTATETAAGQPGTAGLVARNPWQPVTVRHRTQALIGGSWTGESQVSLLAEAWWDGTAPSDGQWAAWRARNQQLAALGGVPGMPAAALAGNLAWQATAFSAAGNLRQMNLFARLSGRLGDWSPALSVLYTPADAGRAVTASLGWQGDALRLEAGLRRNGGPDAALLSQVPTRQSAYLTGQWRF